MFSVTHTKRVSNYKKKQTFSLLGRDLGEGEMNSEVDGRY